MAPYKGYDIIHIYIHGLCILLTAVSVPHHFMSMYIKFQSGHTQFFKINFNICFFSNGECAAQVQNQRSVYCERVGGGGKNESKLKVETHPRMATNF